MKDNFKATNTESGVICTFVYTPRNHEYHVSWYENCEGQVRPTSANYSVESVQQWLRSGYLMEVK